MAEVAKPAAWRSCDMKQIAFLLYCGYHVTRLGHEQNRVFFEFEDTQKLQDDLLQFWNKEKNVEPVAFLDSLNRARDMVTQALRK